MQKALLNTLLGCGIIILIFLSGCEKSPTESPRPSLKNIRGITLANWSAFGYNSNETGEQLDAIADLGANHLAILITAYQVSKNSNEIRLDNTRTPRFSSIQNCMSWAISRGLQVTLKPQVNVDDGSWSGDITPGDPQAWFASYNEFILPLAEMAESAGAARFMVGTELAGTMHQRELWRETIENVRAVFSGELTYAASWDEAEQIPFWDLLDYAGVNFYFPVANRRNPGRLEILQGWQPWLNYLELLHIKIGKKIILTEIGYRSADGAGMQPHNFSNYAPIDLQEQADLYWAAFEATRGIGWIEGMYWWNWLADGGGGPENSDYTPAGKPAEKEIISFWKNSIAQ